jgi:SSS family solute:Na+ symporter
MNEIERTLAIVLGLHVSLLVGISIRSARRVATVDDYLVAGRRLGLMLSTGTLLATWYGAGTVLAASDEVRRVGLSGAVLDPLGAGLCLLLAGLFLAGPLRRLELDTLGDFFRVRFGPRAEIVGAILMAPPYLGWIAAQFVALSGVLEATLGVPHAVGILLVALVGLVTALFGGMWSVTLTDALHMAIVVIGLLALTWGALSALASGTEGDLFTLADALTPEHTSFFVDDGVTGALLFVGVLSAGALGNLPGQDLFQRVFSAKNEATAVRACLLSGMLYLIIGSLPVVIGLAARALDSDSSTGLAGLAERVLSPGLYVVLIVALFSAVISTVNSAILSPAALLSQNVVGRLMPATRGSLRSLRILVIIVTLGSVGLAFVGESAYALLESAYGLPLAALFVPLIAGARFGARSERGALLAMGLGASLYLTHLALGWERFLGPFIDERMPFPVALTCACIAALVQLLQELMARARTPASV